MGKVQMNKNRWTKMGRRLAAPFFSVSSVTEHPSTIQFVSGTLKEIGFVSGGLLTIKQQNYIFSYSQNKHSHLGKSLA